MRSKATRKQHSWVGPEGIASLASVMVVSSPDPDRFRADWQATSTGDIEIGEWRSTAFVGWSNATEPGPLRLEAVIDGGMEYRLDGGAYTAPAGSVSLVHVGRPLHYVSTGPLRVARVELSGAALPHRLRESPPLPDGPLPSTTLTSGFVALLDRLTVSLREYGDEAPAATATAVAALAAALLEEAIPAEDDGGDLRQRIVAHIDRNLGDRDLGPRRIAGDFGVSVRWVHRVFNQEDESVARFIRERRVDAIAAMLRRERRRAPVSDLAVRFGFAGRDQLTRVFKQRYGMTVNEYLDAVLHEAEPSARVLVRN